MKLNTRSSMLLAPLMAVGWLSTAQGQTPSPAPAAAEKKWVCTVTDAQLVYFKYDGGKWADVHLAQFSRPGSYQMARDGDVATGKTSNGTPITCKLG